MTEGKNEPERDQKTQKVAQMGDFLEATAGFEPANGGFADLCLTTWLRRHKIAIGISIAKLSYHDLLGSANLTFLPKFLNQNDPARIYSNPAVTFSPN